MSYSRLSLLTGSLMVVIAVAGCGEAISPRYGLNMVDFKLKLPVDTTAAAEDVAKAEARNQQLLQDINHALLALFGTPDEPRLPPGMDEQWSAINVDIDKLKLAAGAVSSDADGTQRGLYRQHCVHCHGITGDGQGPTARFLNPYPRDYRTGAYKAKSTELAERPTHSDLQHVLEEGIRGTSMPSFRLLPESEREALLQYVKYLAVRGEVERSLVGTAVGLSEGEPFPLDAAFLKQTVAEVLDAWQSAEEKVVQPPAPTTDNLAASIERGRALFMDEKKGNCKKCHGVLALGDGTLDGYDDWNQAVVDLAKVDQDAAATYGLPVRYIQPRNLRQGVYRFGRRPLDIYRRVHQGIKGSPMPGAGQTLTADEIWDIVNYVKSLPYESISRPQVETLGVERGQL